MSGCSCYWGCSTKGNRLVWFLIALVATAGIALTVVGGVLNRNCVPKYNDCVNTSINDQDIWHAVRHSDGTVTYETSQQDCANKYQDECGLIRNGALTLAGLGLLVILMPILMGYFCCCASRPVYCAHPAATHMVAGPTVAVAAPIKGYSGAPTPQVFGTAAV